MTDDEVGQALKQIAGIGPVRSPVLNTPGDYGLGHEDVTIPVDAAIVKAALFDASHRLLRLIGRPTTPLSDMVATPLFRVER